jgi:hypothetical protein
MAYSPHFRREGRGERGLVSAVEPPPPALLPRKRGQGNSNSLGMDGHSSTPKPEIFLNNSKKGTLSSGIFFQNGKRNTHGIPLVRIKIMGKEGWNEVKKWKANL